MNQRQEEILTCVVNHFIGSNQPISSNMVLDQLSIQLSSASVRQVFSVLDHDGYLEKLHTSSGRIPTDKGYRAYVDKIKGESSGIFLDRVVTDTSYQSKFRYYFDQLLTNIAKKIPYISMIMLNTEALADIATIKYVSISSQYGLVLLFHKVGIISEHYVRFDQDVSVCEFDPLISWLQSEFQRSTNIPDIQAVFSEKDAYFLQTIMATILNSAAGIPLEKNVMVKNVNQCLSLSDYTDKHQIQALLNVLDDHDTIQRLMMAGLNANGLDVLIGNELGDSRLVQSSFISIPICLDGLQVACLGILGPSRMDYQSIIQLLSSPETLAELI